jgi:putative ABC transport system permease protein
MLKKYVSVIFRNLKKNKVFSIIDVVGLTLGIACCILLLLWVRDELSYDRFHKNTGEIYRVIAEKNVSDQLYSYATTPNALGPALKAGYPEIVNFTRYCGGWVKWLVRYGDKTFMNDRLAVADPSFFEMFDFTFIKGDPATALKERYSAVLTENMAKKYFEKEEPMGKIIRVLGMDLKVTGIIKNIPHNSNMQFDYIFPIINMSFWWRENLESWERDVRFDTYIQLQKNSSAPDVNRKIAGLVKKNHPGSNTLRVFLQPAGDIHLYSDFEADFNNIDKGSIANVYIFSLIALCILMIACINFINLSTARAGERAKEIGIRKVVGADRIHIIKQFLGESILLAFAALLLAIILVYIFLPSFNSLSGKHITLRLDFFDNILALLGITLFTGLVAGSYPAVFLSSFQPVSVLKGAVNPGKGSGLFLRKILVVAQFTFTIILIIGTTVIYSQLHYIRNRDLGFDKDNIIHFNGYGEFVRNPETVKNVLLKHPGIQGVTTSMAPVATYGLSTDVRWEGKNPEEQVAMSPVVVDYDYLETFNMKMVEGRFFSRDFPTDRENFVLNEAAAAAMKIGSPIGKRFWFRGSPTAPLRQGIIIGVIKNYHQGSLHQKIVPLVLMFSQHHFSYYCVKISRENVKESIRFLEDQWKKIVGPGYPFSYDFLNETIENHYKTEQRVNTIVEYFTILAILISSLGLLGLVSFTIAQRTKEIGIRKVLGASVSQVTLLLIKTFVRWLLLANVIAWPIGWYFANRWLNNFAYRISMGVWIFVFAGAVTLIIALSTVGMQTIKAAKSNPVDNLKYE